MPVASRVEAFAITVPASTPASAPVTTHTLFANGSVVHIELDVPAGHTGHTGIQILAAGAQYLPKTFGTYIVADNHVFAWDTIVTINTGQWAVKAYNTDVYPHTFYVRYSVLDFGYQEAAQAVAPLPVAPVLI